MSGNEILTFGQHAWGGVVFNVVGIVGVVAETGDGCRVSVAGDGLERVFVAEIGDSPLGGFGQVVVPSEGDGAVVDRGVSPVIDGVGVGKKNFEAAEGGIGIGTEVNEYVAGPTIDFG